jgi:hypothetical protein
MNIYKNIEKYKDYFHSVRLHDNIFLFDLKLPTRWEIKNVISAAPTTTQIKINDQSETHVLISFYTPFESESVATLLNDVDRVLKFNKDREEKNNLLNMKKLELEKIFESNNIDSLRTIDFNFQKTNGEINLNETKPNLAGEGN